MGAHGAVIFSSTGSDPCTYNTSLRVDPLMRMADPISIASGLLALAGFALQSSKSLYKTVESFRSSQRTMHELEDELEALDGVLRSLHTATNNHAGLA